MSRIRLPKIHGHVRRSLTVAMIPSGAMKTTADSAAICFSLTPRSVLLVKHCLTANGCSLLLLLVRFVCVYCGARGMFLL